MTTVHDLLEAAIRNRASDLVIKSGAPPAIRVDGLMQVTDQAPLTAAETRELALEIIYSAGRDYMLERGTATHGGDEQADLDSDTVLKQLYDRNEVDLVFTIPKLARVRANIFLERNTIGAVLRVIPLRPYTVDDLSLPPLLKDLAMQPQGLVIITGPTGSGKTTTMAAFIEEINRRRPANIFTVEEPIEYVYEDKKSVIHQREVGRDTHTFATALRSVTRQTPDVIAIGELRDAETMDVAMTAAEIGHLVVTTLHTVSAAATVDRIISSFPQHLKSQTAAQLAASLLCVTSQRLVKRSTGQGRLPAVEVMSASPTVRKQIEEGDHGELYVSMREGQHFGMNTMNQALEKLYTAGQIHYDDAIQFAGNVTELKQMLRGSKP